MQVKANSIDDYEKNTKEFAEWSGIHSKRKSTTALKKYSGNPLINSLVYND